MSNKKVKILGTVLIIIAIIFLAFSVKNLFFKEEVKENQKEDVVSEELPANDARDITEKEAKEVMKLKIQMPEEMQKELIPDMAYFKSEFEKWLTKEDYWADVSRAKTDFVITKDYNHKNILMTFFLNDYMKTEVQVTYNYGENKYEFNQV